MGRRLRRVINTLKDTATITTATLSPTTNSATLAVLRATPHHPSTSPPSPHHLTVLLSFGHNSRLSASSLLSALSLRLRTSSDPAVSLKSLLALHHLLSHAPFVLRDHLLNLPPHSFDLSPSSSDNWPLSHWLLFLSRLLTLRIAAASAVSDDELITSLLNHEVILELEALVRVVEEIAGAPGMVGVENNELVGEVVKLVMSVRSVAEIRMLERVRELGCRVGFIGFGDAIELVCLLKRFMECRSRPLDWGICDGDGLWGEVKGLLDRVEVIVVEKEEEERRRICRDKFCGSERIVSREFSGSDLKVRFGSSRWVG